MGIRVVTDSSACIPQCLVDQLGITVLDLHAMGSGDDASTSGLSALELCAAYARQLERGGDAGVIAVHLSKELSSTWSAASTAAGVFDKKVRVIDTDSTGMVIGAAAIAAAKAAHEGATLDECETAAVAVTGNSHLWLYVHKIDALRKSGRMSTGASLLSSALPFKLLFELRDGSFSVAARTRTQTKAMSKMVATVIETVGDRQAVVCVHSTGPSAIAQQVAQDLRQQLPRGSAVLEVNISAALEVHTGAGAIAVSVVFPPDSDTDSATADGDSVEDLSDGSHTDPTRSEAETAQEEKTTTQDDGAKGARAVKKRSKREAMMTIGVDAARQLKFPKASHGEAGENTSAHSDSRSTKSDKKAASKVASSRGGKQEDEPSIQSSAQVPTHMSTENSVDHRSEAGTVEGSDESTNEGTVEGATQGTGDATQERTSRIHHSPFDVKIVRSLGKFGHGNTHSDDPGAPSSKGKKSP